ncbi:hypothetical protein Bca101_016569 [Brassica carinata]
MANQKGFFDLKSVRCSSVSKPDCSYTGRLGTLNVAGSLIIVMVSMEIAVDSDYFQSSIHRRSSEVNIRRGIQGN